MQSRRTKRDNATVTPDESYAGDVTDVRVLAELDTTSNYIRLWQPYIANMGNGHLVACYGAQYGGKVDLGDIFEETGSETYIYSPGNYSFMRHLHQSFFFLSDTHKE